MSGTCKSTHMTYLLSLLASKYGSGCLKTLPKSTQRPLSSSFFGITFWVSEYETAKRNYLGAYAMGRSMGIRGDQIDSILRVEGSTQ